MTNYVQSTNFATKDALSSGNALKIVKGTEINTEYANIAIAVATKADLASPTFTGTPTLPTGTIATTQSFGNSSTAVATTAFVQAAMALLHPVGSIYTAVVATNPNTLFGFGTWTAFGAGRMLISLDSSNVLFDTAEETGGAANSIVVSHTHTATVTDPGHVHPFSADQQVFPGSLYGGGTTGVTQTNNTSSAVTGISVANSTAGSSGTNANYPPFIAVYMWKRTA